MKPVKHTLYKIYYNIGLVYVGRTNQPLNARLRGHFKKTPMMRQIEIEAVTLIESVEVPTEADMYVYEIYLINKHKPCLNGNIGKGELTAELPELEFKPYTCKLLDKWKAELVESDKAYNDRKAEKRRRMEEKRAQRIKSRVQLENGEITVEEYQARLYALYREPEGE